MDTKTYRIVFSGEIVKGRSLDDVITDVASLYKVERTEIEWIFSKRQLVLKQHLDHRTAVAFMQAFEKAGLVCRLEAIPPPPARDTRSATADPQPPQGRERPLLQTSMTGLVSLLIASLVLAVYLIKPGIPFFRTIAEAPVDNLIFFLFAHYPGPFLSVVGILLCLFGTILGIAGLIELQRKRMLPVAGLILNLSTAALVGWGTVGLVAQGFPDTFQQRIDIPDAPGGVTQKDVNQTMLAWMQRHTVVPFTANVPSTATWKPAAREFLLQICNHVADQAGHHSAGALQAAGRKLIDQGCTDALVLLWYGRMCLLNKNYPEAHTWTARALEDLGKSDYPAVQTFFAAKTLGQIEAWSQDQSEATVYRWNRAGMHALAKAISSDAFEPAELPLAFRLAYDTFDDQIMVDFRWVVQGNGCRDRWLLLVIQGAAEIEAAWIARGGGWAKDVTPEGWRGFREHLEKANKLLKEAWQLRPDNPEAAALMITVAMGGHADPGETEETWFNRSVAAQIDYRLAYTNLLWALQPRWCGSLDRMQRFGEACLNTGRFDTDIPLFYLRALRDMAGLQEHNGWRHVFRREGVHEKLTQLFTGLLSSPARQADADRIRTQQALTEAWCGNYAAAAAMLGEVPDEMNLLDGFWGKALSWGSRKRSTIDAELRLFNGPYAKRMQAAEELCLARRSDEALAVFEAVMADNRSDRAVHAYLLNRIALIRMGDAAFTAFPALYYAARENHTDVARFLIENGADVNERTNHGDTALHTAVHKGHADVVEQLLAAGADVNITNNKNRLPLHDALGQEFPAIATMLLQAGSRIDPVSLDGWSPLHLAVRYNQPQMAIALIRQGARIDIPNLQHWTPLHMALQYTDQEVSALLIAGGAGVNTPTGEGWGPLHLAILNQHPRMAELLIQKGADVNARTPEGHTPLQIAVDKGLTSVVDRLVRSGANVSAENTEGWSPLHLAAYRGDLHTVKVLLANGADAQRKLADGRTPLMVAQLENHTETAQAIAAFTRPP